MSFSISKLKLLEWGSKWPDAVIHGLTRPHGSPSAASLIFSADKAKALYAGSCGHFTTLPKNSNTKLLITIAAQQLLAGKETLASMRAEMTRLAKQLPEYNTVLAMYGIGETTAAQLMAEIGDVRRFPHRSSIVGFAGIDPAVDE